MFSKPITNLFYKVNKATDMYIVVPLMRDHKESPQKTVSQKGFALFGLHNRQDIGVNQVELNAQVTGNSGNLVTIASELTEI